MRQILMDMPKKHKQINIETSMEDEIIIPAYNESFNLDIKTCKRR